LSPWSGSSQRSWPVSSLISAKTRRGSRGEAHSKTAELLRSRGDRSGRAEKRYRAQNEEGEEAGPEQRAIRCQRGRLGPLRDLFPQRGAAGIGAPRIGRLLEDEAGVADRLQPLARFLPQAAAQEIPDRGGCRRRQTIEIRLVLHDRREQVCHSLAFEEPRAGQYLVEHDAEGPDVGPAIDRHAAGDRPGDRSLYGSGLLGQRAGGGRRHRRQTRAQSRVIRERGRAAP
jgi:hypothetical protein